jgi:hypothetical protein
MHRRAANDIIRDDFYSLASCELILGAPVLSRSSHPWRGAHILLRPALLFADGERSAPLPPTTNNVMGKGTDCSPHEAAFSAAESHFAF